MAAVLKAEDRQVNMKVFVPNKLAECIPRSASLPKERLRWNANEEIASFLISFDKHEEWLSYTLKTRPANGSIILYNRKKVKYRKDGYCWKKRKDGKTTREDHMKLKVQGIEKLASPVQGSPVRDSCGSSPHSVAGQPALVCPTKHIRLDWSAATLPAFLDA
ncbi:Calmodulin-binding transcription activator 1 [Merluccius polli]|uniref:Calmodulin-binding transcription activator 1 n=1 Tax=Merluccius polli TaxID=89951 RepID=A0AA47MI67_MERPO|nr:Calmodulin-binding transcription activator 1 [Merluccius polli]